MSNTFFQGGKKFSRGASPLLLPPGYGLADLTSVSLKKLFSFRLLSLQHNITIISSQKCWLRNNVVQARNQGCSGGSEDPLENLRLPSKNVLDII